MTLANACPKPEPREKSKRKPVSKASPKTIAKNGGKLPFSSIAKPTPEEIRERQEQKRKKFTPAVLDGLKPYTSMPRQSSPMPERTKRIPKVNPKRAAKRDKGYAAGLKRYHASETAKIVKARADGRCEFLVADDAERIPRVIAVRVDRPAPKGYSRCNQPCRAMQDHHLTYARFGGDELPEDIVRGEPGCHEYVEAMKAAHRRRRRSA